MLNIYDYHNNPDSIHGHENKAFAVPSFAYQALIKDMDSPYKLKYERAISNSAEYSLMYAQHTKKRFPLGEHKIAQEVFYFATYVDILTSRAPELEPEIFKYVQIAAGYLEHVGYFNGADKLLADGVANTLDPGWRAMNMRAALEVMNNLARKRSPYIDALLDTDYSMLNKKSAKSYQAQLELYKKL